VTSPQGFEGLRATGRKVHAAGEDAGRGRSQHTDHRPLQTQSGSESIEQMRVMAENAREFGIEYYNEFDKRQGIVHVIGPAGLYAARNHHRLRRQPTPPPMARSARWRTASAPQRSSMCWRHKPDPEKSQEHARRGDGNADGVNRQGHSSWRSSARSHRGGTGYVLEYAGDAIRALSMEGRMTVCKHGRRRRRPRRRAGRTGRKGV